jgi:hypothetical protein
MPVYFIRERRDGYVKIGVSSEVRRRLSQLQTGSPTDLELMGWLKSRDDYGLESRLHREYGAYKIRGEWFSIDQDDVLEQLMRHQGFVPRNADAFEIVGYDRDGIPEYSKRQIKHTAASRRSNCEGHFPVVVAFA